MNKLLNLLIIILLLSCNSINREQSVSNKLDTIAVEKIKYNYETSTINSHLVIIDSLKKLKIDWDSIATCKLPINTKTIQNGLISLDKYCCQPGCDKNYRLNELDALFSNNTDYKTKANHYNNGHPSKKQGYFGIRLPDIGDNKVLFFSYYDIDVSDYKTCTIELQIFDNKNQLVDKMIIQDGLYYECGWDRIFSIDTNYIMQIKDYSYCVDLEEGKQFDVKRYSSRYNILNSGKIKMLYKDNLHQGNCENFDDYINDYELVEQTPKLSKDERQTYFNKLLALTPSVSLPYNSGDFYHYMTIENPEKDIETQLFHEQLKKPEKVAFFISKNKLSAFKDNKEGNFFYPIFRFNRTPDIITIGFLYQSYCNYNKAIYVKLVNYNPQGNIVDEWIVDRRFFSGDCRVLSSIEFLEDFTVKLKRYIQNFEGYGYEGYEENDGRNAKQFQEVYTITENGEFKKK